jgi:hypothetical protein
MATFWKEPVDPARHRDFMGGGYQGDGVLDVGGWPIIPADTDGWVYFVRVASFTFSFVSLEQLEGALSFFDRTVHPARRRPGPRLEHYWQRWFERLPPGLVGGSKRSRIHRALMTALSAFANSSARQPATPASRRRVKARRTPLEPLLVVLAGVVPPSVDLPNFLILAATTIGNAGHGLMGSVIQRRGVSRSRAPGGASAARSATPLDAATYLGAGKVRELARLCRAENPDVVMFLNPLSGSQLRRLELAIETPVVAAPTELSVAAGLENSARPDAKRRHDKTATSSG